MFQDSPPPPPGFVLNPPTGGPAPSGGGLTRITPPKARDPREEAKEARTESRADTNTGLSIESGERSQKGQVQDYRKEFRSSPPVKTYEIAMQSLANAVKRGDDGSGDVALIYDYAKAMDPESVVRESEVGMAQSGQSMVDSAVARYKKEFGIEGGGALTPQLRQRLRREIINAARSRRQAYEQQRKYFEDIASRSGFNPDDIVGPHLGEPYREELSHYGVSGRKFTDAEMAARARGREGADGGGFLPGATPDNIAFDMDTGTGAFGSQTQADRLSPEDEAFVQSYLQSRMGDPKFSGADEVNAILRARGIEGTIGLDPETVKAIREGKPIGAGIDYSDADAAAREKADAMARERYGDDYSTRASSLLKGITGGWSDELAGVAGGVYDTATGGSFAEGYQRERDTERAVQRKSRDDYGLKYELAGGLAMPLGMLKAPKTVGEFAAQGAKVGAIAGAGEGEGVGGTITGTLAGAGTGGLTGAGIGKIAQSEAGRKAVSYIADKAAKIGDTATGRIPRNAVSEAGERQGVPIRLADAVPSKARELAVLESSPNVGQKISDTLASDVQAFGDRVAGLGSQGRALDTLPRGDMIQKAGGRFLARTRQKASELYDTAKKAGGDEVVDAAPFIQDVDNRIAQLKANGEEANGGVISMLESMKRDLSKGLTVGKLQAQRTTLRSRLDSAGLTMDPNQAQLSDALSVAADVLKGGLSKPGAREALNAADAFYSDRQKFIGGVLKHFSDRKGNISPETAAKRFDQFLKEGGNFRVVQKMFGELEPAERASVASSVAQSLGRNAKGEFSYPIFLNNISGKNAALSDRAKFLLFGKDGVRAIKDLELIARAKMGAEGSFNRSRSATTLQGGFRLKDSLMSLLGVGGVAGAGGDTLTTLAAGAAAYGASRGISKLSDARKASLFLNPRFTTWLKDAPDTADPAVIGKYLDRLNKIASRDQAFLMDANAIRDYVAGQISKGSGRAAAEEQPENSRRK